MEILWCGDPVVWGTGGVGIRVQERPRCGKKAVRGWGIIRKECLRIPMGAPFGGPALGALGSVPIAAAPPVRPEPRPVPTGIGTKAARGTALNLFQCGRAGRSGDVGNLIRTDRCYERQTVPLADLTVHCSPCPLGLCSVWIGSNRPPGACARARAPDKGCFLCFVLSNVTVPVAVYGITSICAE